MSSFCQLTTLIRHDVIRHNNSKTFYRTSYGGLNHGIETRRNMTVNTTQTVEYDGYSSDYGEFSSVCDNRLFYRSNYVFS